MPPSSGISKTGRLTLAFILLGVAVLLSVSRVLQKPAAVDEHAPIVVPQQPVFSQVAPATATNSVIQGDHRLQDICDALRKESDSRTISQQLAELRLSLQTMPRKEAASAIRRFLDTKSDASTRLGFKVASNGLLDQAPTLRTFLLDELGRLDPSAAADYSKLILAGMDSPDEWAVALRNLALGDASADGRALLSQKTAQMLQYAPWQQNPSTGYLEAFDVPVYLGGAEFVPTLSSLVQSQDNPAISHAAFLALDRLVINNPTAVLQSLESAPDLMTGRESTRADYFGRADVRDPQQREILESYLLNPSIGPAELQTFAGIYPNENFMISPNLLTQNTTIDHEGLIDRDQQSLAVAQQWLADPRFAQITPVLQTIVQRLQTFAAQARQGQ
ncbi:MAG TPA: hypothetical protein VHZ30_03985 [Verrucomicrobiae bacterium]|jgi:hypothetical protein|nr:hypothetical protein [Verrucomicrobiae bacterium]